MTHASNICNHPPPMPLHSHLELAVKTFWGRGQKKRKVISRNSVNCHQKAFSRSFPVPWIQLEASPLGRPTHNRPALPLAARQTEETAAYHKSVTHGPNGHHEGWAPLPPNYHLADTQKRSLEINGFFSVARSHKLSLEPQNGLARKGP